MGTTRLAGGLAAFALAGAAVLGQNPAQTPPPATQPPPAQPEAVRPPDDNDRTLRPLGANEIPPNLSFYAIDPLYKPGVPLGWASTRIEETLNRGLDVIPDGERGMYLTWRSPEDRPRERPFRRVPFDGGRHGDEADQAAASSDDRLPRHRGAARQGEHLVGDAGRRGTRDQ